MSFRYHHDGVGPIMSYEDAVEREATIKPIRGRADKPKPLGERKKWHYCSIRRDGDLVYTRHHGVNASFYPDNTIVMNREYTPGSVCSIISSLLGVPTVRRFNSVWIKCLSMDGDTERCGYLPLSAEPTRFNRLGSGALFYVDPVFPKDHRLNRKVVNKELAPYKGFIAFAKGMVKLRDNTFNLDEFEQARNRAKEPDYLHNMPDKMLSEDPVVRHDVLMKLMGMVSFNSRYNHNYYTNTLTVKPAPIVRKIQEVIYRCSTNKDLFTAVEIRDGRVVMDTNAHLIST